MAIVVQKFGGSSVATPERMRRVAARVAETADAGNQVAVVVSAMGDTTDDLIELSRQATAAPTDREMDMLLPTGEQQSIAMLAMTLNQMGYDAISLTGAQAGYHTDGVYSHARIVSIENSRVLRELQAGRIVIVAGFQGVAPDGEINTLGRGGSDTSAVALAIATDADVCEIYTDVDGIYTADPRVVKKAVKMNSISYDEMLEMAAMGAVVLQTRSVELAKQYGVTMCVRSSFNHNPGTIVKEVADMEKQLEKEWLVSGVAQDLNVLKVTLFGVPDEPGIACRIFGPLAEQGVNVDMIIQSGTRDKCQDVSFTCGRDQRAKVEKLMEQLIADLPAEHCSIFDNVAKVSVVGAGMLSHSGVAATMFRVLCEHNINIEMISTSEIKVSVIVDETKAREAMIALHTAYGLDGDVD